MPSHVKVVAILNMVYGSLIALVGGVVMLLLGGFAGIIGYLDSPSSLDGLGIVGIVGAAIGGLLLLIAAPSIIAGVGLLYRKEWARVLTIVLSALHLIQVPFGTALGIYGLWALLKPETEAFFRNPGPAHAH